MSEQYVSYSNKGWKGYVLPGLEEYFSNPDEWIAGKRGKIIVNYASRNVVSAECPSGNVFVKSIVSLDDKCRIGNWKWFKWRFGPSRSLQTFNNTKLMRTSGISCPRTLFVARRTCGLNAYEIFASEAIDALSIGRHLRLITEQDNQIELVKIVASQLAEFHRKGFVHGDCIPGNLLWDGKCIYFIDNDRSWKPPHFLRHYAQQRNLVQLGFHLAAHMRDITFAHILLNEYSAEMPLFDISAILNKIKIRILRENAPVPLK